jgi:hypothetical protein
MTEIRHFFLKLNPPHASFTLDMTTFPSQIYLYKF